MRALVAFVLAFNLTGCGSIAWKMPSGIERSVVTPSNSLVVLSTWAQDKSISSASEIAIRRKVDGKAVAGAPIDSYVLKSHFPVGWGFLSAFELPPGEYVISLYALNPFMTYGGMESPIQFTLRGGEVAYIGEAHFYNDSGYGVIEMRDRFERDIEMFVSHNPGFSPNDFVKMIPETKK